MSVPKRLLSNTGVQVSIIGLGCMGMSPFVGDNPSVETSLETIGVALSEGINLFNTAESYGPNGHNELLLGKAIKKYGRDKFFITSKFGPVRNSEGAYLYFNGSAENARRCLELTLQRLGTDYVDAYGPARVDPKVPFEDTIKELARLKEEGKVRFLLLSEASSADIRKAHAVHPITFLESEFSLWSLHLRDQGVLATIRELNITLLAYSPLGRGFLTGELKKAEDLPASDVRRHFPRFSAENFENNIALVKEVEKLAKRKGATNVQLALAWVLAQGHDIIPIPGTTKPERVRELAGAAKIALTNEDLAEIDNILANFPVKGARIPAFAENLLTRELPK